MRAGTVSHAVQGACGLFALAGLCTSIACAQWLHTPAKGIPRLPDGKPNLTAPAPKKPDLTGTWTVPPVTLGEGGPPRYATYLAADLPEGAVPLKPAARALIRERLANFGRDIPFSRCLPAGLPMATMFPAPFKIIQNRGSTIILYETRGAYRQIFTDGRTPPNDPNPAWMGYSIGHWERDVFVVESAGFNDKTWIDGVGYPHGEKLRLTERFHRRDFGHIDLQVTIDDPDWYEKPWAVKVALEMTPDTELLEDVCLENERDVRHMVGR
jgi:hypothetical protein